MYHTYPTQASISARMLQQMGMHCGMVALTNVITPLFIKNYLQGYTPYPTFTIRRIYLST